MPNIFPYQRTQKENQHFFLNSIEIPGVQTVNGSYQSIATPVSFIGNAGTAGKFRPDGNQIANLSINYLLISTDQFIQYTGNLGFNSYVVNNLSNLDQNYSFLSGYLTSYNIRQGVNQLPEVSINANIYGQIGKINPQAINLNTQSVLPLLIPAPNTASLGINDFNTNAVQSYSITINTQRNPTYILGQTNPNAINQSLPLEITADFEILVNDYTATNMSAYPFNIKTNNLNLTLTDYYTNRVAATYGFNNMILVGENCNVTTNSNGITMNLQYKSIQN